MMAPLVDLRRPGILSELTLAGVKLWQKITSDNIDRLNVAAGEIASSGTGDVVGPSSATSSNLTSFNGATGKLVKDSGVASSALITTSTSASGDLGGTYPSPTVAAIHETSGPTKLTLGSVTDGQILVRSGSTLIGTAMPTTVRATVSTTDNTFHAILAITVPTDKTLCIAVRFVGRRTNGSNESLNGRIFTGAKNIAGDVTWNAANDIIADEKIFTGDDGNYSIKSGRSNPTAVFSVRGNTGHNMDWVAMAEYFVV